MQIASSCKMQEFCNHTNKNIRKKNCTRQTNNKLKKELQEKIIKNKAKLEVEEAIKGKTKKIDIRAATPFLGVSSNVTKKTSMKGKSTKSCQAAMLTQTNTKAKFSIVYMLKSHNALDWRTSQTRTPHKFR